MHQTTTNCKSRVCDDLCLIQQLVAQGGPDPSDYPLFDEWIHQVYDEHLMGLVSSDDLMRLRQAFGDALSPLTLQGFSLHKPHGYAGDFEIIDRIYRGHISEDPLLAAWDKYFTQHSATRAVRNRKSYFHEVLNRHHKRTKPLRVLNIASGPGRCIFEWLSNRPTAQASFHCIEYDPKAIAYAQDLNERFLDRVTFERVNALRYRPTRSYDVIWAGGIFDYFNDRVFDALLRRLIPHVKDGGELIIGNFSDCNRSRPYMELVGDWHLHHRSPRELFALARAAGVPVRSIRVGSEPERVNNFLHITKSSRI